MPLAVARKAPLKAPTVPTKVFTPPTTPPLNFFIPSKPFAKSSAPSAVFSNCFSIFCKAFFVPSTLLLFFSKSFDRFFIFFPSDFVSFEFLPNCKIEF